MNIKYSIFKGLFILTVLLNLNSCGGGNSNNESSSSNFLSVNSYNYITNQSNSTADSVTVNYSVGGRVYSTDHSYDSNSSFHSYQESPFPANSLISIIRSSDSTELFVARDLGLVKNKSHLLIAMGDIALGNVDAIVYFQDRTIPASTKVRMRFVHALSKLPLSSLINVELQGSNVAKNLNYKEASSYVDSSPRVTTSQPPLALVDIVLKQKQVEIARRTCTVTQGSVYEVVLGYKDFNNTLIEIFCHSQGA